MAVHDKLKFIEELNNIKELTLAGTSYPFNQHIIKYIDILKGVYEKEVKQYEDDMWEEHMSKKRNPTYHSFHENFTPDLWKNAKKELEEKTTVFDENDFEAVSERQSIESDAERIESNRAKYVLIEPTSLPRRPGSNVPSIVEFAIKTTNPIGTQLYARPFASKTRFEWNCSKYSSQSAAQEAFLVWGGPKVDPKGIDPDGDGFACYWDPKPFRSVLKDNN